LLVTLACLQSASAWDFPDFPVVKTGHWFHSSIHPFGLTFHFKVTMGMATRDPLSVVRTTNHKDLSSHGHASAITRHGPSNQGTPHHIPSQLNVDGTKIPPKKAKSKSALSWNFLQTKLVVIQNLLYRSSLHLSSFLSTSSKQGAQDLQR